MLLAIMMTSVTIKCAAFCTGCVFAYFTH